MELFFNNQNSYNTNLWTMYIELSGSFIVFAILAFFGTLKRRWLIYSALALIFIHSWYLAFLLGLVICDIWVNMPGVKRFLTSRSFATALLLFGILAGSWHFSFNAFPSFYSHFRLPFFSLTGTEQFMRTLGAASLIVAVLGLSWLSRFFESRPLQYLGRISFSLYLLHLTIIYSFSCLLFNRLLPHVGYTAAFIFMFSISMPIILMVSHYYTRWVDAPAITLSKRVGDWLVSSRLGTKKVESVQQKESAPKAPLPVTELATSE